MTNDDVTELHNDLLRRSEACAKRADEYARDGDTADARRADGKAVAYRHAAELLMAAAKDSAP